MFFPYVYSRYAFFCYQGSLHVISYQATTAKEQEYLLSSQRKPNSSFGLYSLNKDVAKTENFKSKWCSNGNELVGLSQSIVLSDKAFRTFIPIRTVFASLVMLHSPAVSKMSKSGKRFNDPDDLPTLLFPFQGGQSVHLSDSKKLNKESLLNPREELLFCLRKIYRFLFYVLVSVASIHNDDWRAAFTFISL